MLKILNLYSSVLPFCSCSSETVNDGRFHTVELVTFNHMVNLSVDGGEPTTLDSQGRIQIGTGDAPLYVGGESEDSRQSGS